ncbi:MAG TPA: hypothetical protein VFI29_08660, partial [Hanamia sp.]|nr:hypothetical protein [Hanamia sp.]
FVNKDRKILNFISSDEKAGFFKYERFLQSVHVGEILKVRFQKNDKDGRYNVYTATKHVDEKFRDQFLRKVEGRIAIRDNNDFGFINDVFVSREIVKKRNLENGLTVSGEAMKSFNKGKNQWGWRML